MRQTDLEWSIAGNVNDSGHFSLMVKFPYYETPQAVVRCSYYTQVSYGYKPERPAKDQLIRVQPQYFSGCRGSAKNFALKNTEKAAENAYAYVLEVPAVSNAKRARAAAAVQALKPLRHMLKGCVAVGGIYFAGDSFEMANPNDPDRAFDGTVEYAGSGNVRITLRKMRTSTAALFLKAMCVALEEPGQFEPYGPNDVGLEPPTG